MQLSSFIERLKLELEDIQQDLTGLPLGKSDCRIGDFGCGWADATLGLMIDRDASECVGIDAFGGKEGVPSLQNVQQGFDYLKTLVLATPESSQDDEILRDMRRLLRNGRWPTFQQSNVLQPYNLPKNLDLAYCRLLLGNILNREYNNPAGGEKNITEAINNIVDCISQDGLFCLVERNVIDFSPFIKQAKLELLGKPRAISRHTIGETGTRMKKPSVGTDFGLDHLVVYHARKR